MIFLIAMLIFFLIGILDMRGVIAIPGSFVTPMMALLAASTILDSGIKKTWLNKILLVICIMLFIAGTITMFVDTSIIFVAELGIFSACFVLLTVAIVYLLKPGGKL